MIYTLVVLASVFCAPAQCQNIVIPAQTMVECQANMADIRGRIAEAARAKINQRIREIRKIEEDHIEIIEGEIDYAEDPNEFHEPGDLERLMDEEDEVRETSEDRISLWVEAQTKIFDRVECVEEQVSK